MRSNTFLPNYRSNTRGFNCSTYLLFRTTGIASMHSHYCYVSTKHVAINKKPTYELHKLEVFNLLLNLYFTRILQQENKLHH